MLDPSDLAREDLEEIVRNLQDQLYLDLVDDTEVYDPDKEWDCTDICTTLAEIACRFNLAPRVAHPPSDE
jgi:hypothetical protein